MKNNRKKALLSLYTFLGVGLSIFAIGYVGIIFSLRYIQGRYVQIQLDVNKRQAEQMAFFLESEIKRGVPLDSVSLRFQSAIEGTQSDKGFLCVYDTKKTSLVCHPNPQAIGMSFTKEFVFQAVDGSSERPISNVYEEEQGVGGIFVQGKERTDIVYSVPVKGTNWYLNAHENISVISAEIRQLRYRYVFGSVVLGLLAAFAASITARKISIRYEKEIEEKNIALEKSFNELSVLHQEVKEQKESILSQRNQLQAQHDIVLAQRDQITHKNKLITDSINYAQRIQAAVLPHPSILNSVFPEFFILYQPKDIVSGDFYWFSKSDHLITVAVADCTGHGVPGAIMSMFGVAFLNEIVNYRKIVHANDILDELRQQIKKALGQNGKEGEQQDGMDIALAVVDTNTWEMEFAGANNPLYLLRQNALNGVYELHETKGDHMPIGIHPHDKNQFKRNLVKLFPNDRIYLFSDGFTSQFGGEKNETFKSRRLKETLLMCQSHIFHRQKDILLEILTDWQGENPQVDDISILGFKVPGHNAH